MVIQEQGIVSLCSWNVLARDYARVQAYPYCAQEYLKLDYRLGSIVGHIKVNNPDIVCLQEVDFPQELEERFTDYDVIFAKRTRKKVDGCLTMWNKETFQLLDHLVVSLNEMVHDDHVPNLSGIQDRYQRDNIGLIVGLLHIPSQSTIVIANAHLFWNPSYEDVKIRQCWHILHKLDQFCNNLKCKQVFYCGDFNSTPESEVVRFVKSGKYVEEQQTYGNGCKFIFEGDLHRVAKWFRVLGIDSTFVQLGKDDHEFIFKTASLENRIIVTRSQKLVQRSNCPRYVLIPSALDHVESFQYLVGYYRIQLDRGVVFHRCTSCNTPVEHISIDVAAEYSDKVPDGLIKDARDTDIQFSRCLTCADIFWWGSRSSQVVDDLEMKIMDSTFTNEQLLLSHKFNFKSAFGEHLDKEPAFTNYTRGFQGTLDYIFYSTDTFKLNSVVELLSEMEILEETALPNSSWPSDHLCLKASFSMQSL